MNHQFKGSLRRIPQQDNHSLYDSRNLPDTLHYPPNRNDNLYRTERSQCSEYSTLNRYQTTSNFDKQGHLKYIYDKNIKVKVSSHQRTQKETEFRIEMEVTTEKPNSVIKINLTDDVNHTFLWGFYLRDVDYPNFKNQQKLKVDFSEFAYSLIRMFDSVIDHPKKYICRFEMQKAGKGSLKILESNQFKENLNLQLKLKQATSEQLVQYLDQRLRRLQQISHEMGIQMQKQGQDIVNQTLQIQKLKQQLSQFDQQKKQQYNNLTLDNKSKLNSLKQQYLNKEINLKKQFQNQKKNLTTKYESEITRLKEKIQDLDRKHRLATQCNQRLESKNRQLQSSNNILTTQNKSCIRNFQIAKEQNNKYQQTIISQSKVNVELTCNLQALQRQLQDKQIIISSSHQIKTNQSSHVQTLESTLSDLKKQLEKKDKTIKERSEELNKLKITLDSYSVKIKDKNTRLKEKDEALINLHKYAEQLKTKDNQSSRLVANINREKEISEVEVKNMKKQIQNCKAELEESKRTIQDSQNMIKHLNKQLTERGLGSTSRIGPQSMIQSNYRTSFNYQPSSTLTKSSLSPSLPMPIGERIQPQIKKYTGNTQLQIPSIKTSEGNKNLFQQQQPQELRQPTVRGPIKYRSPSQTKL